MKQAIGKKTFYVWWKYQTMTSYAGLQCTL